MPGAPMDAPLPKKVNKLIKWLDEGNIVSKLADHKDLTPAEVYEDIMQAYGEAEESMGKWLRKYKAAINLAKMQPTAGGQEIESKDFPFEGASVAMMPLPVLLLIWCGLTNLSQPRSLAWTRKS
jgi:hypothetical protein